MHRHALAPELALEQVAVAETLDELGRDPGQEWLDYGERCPKFAGTGSRAPAILIEISQITNLPWRGTGSRALSLNPPDD